MFLKAFQHDDIAASFIGEMFALGLGLGHHEM